jgi:hypothetical protein
VNDGLLAAVVRAERERCVGHTFGVVMAGLSANGYIGSQW